MPRRLAALAALVPVVATLLVAVPTTSAEAGQVVRVRLHRAIKHLPVARETRHGYDRDKFRHWVDADHDCRDTRDEVLAAESRVRVHGCDVRRGRWRSYYDHVTVRRSSRLDIDHLVPLAEAWDSGAKRWTARARTRFANDLGDPRSLVAVTASANRSKSDRDPAEWQPRFGKCLYLRQWVAVKTRWSLSVDRAEKHALLRRSRHCANRVVKVRKVTVHHRRRHHSGGSGGATGGSTGGLDHRFDTCGDANAHGYGNYVRGRDPEYDWYRDADGDGIVCEF